MTFVIWMGRIKFKRTGTKIEIAKIRTIQTIGLVSLFFEDIIIHQLQYIQIYRKENEKEIKNVTNGRFCHFPEKTVFLRD